MYRLFADRLIRLFSHYVEVDGERVLDGRFFHGPYPNPDMFKLVEKSDFPVACLTLVDSPIKAARRVQSTEEVEGTVPVEITVKEVRAEVQAVYQVDVLHDSLSYLWGADFDPRSGVMNQMILLTCENPWLADSAGDQCLRCRPASGAMNMDGLELTDRYHRGAFQVYLDGAIITERDAVRVAGVIWELEGAEV